VRPTRRFALGLSLVVIAAIAIRMWAALALAPDEPEGDAFYFHHQGRLIADGHWFVHPHLYEEAGQLEPSAIHPPLFPLFLASLSFLGADGFGSHQLAGAFVGTATVVLVALLGRRLASDRAGLTAGALAALYPNLWVGDGTVMSETLYGLLVAASLLAAYRLLNRATRPSAALLGAAVGAAALARGEGLALVVLLLWPTALLLTRPAAPAFGRRIALTGIATAVVATVLAPWTLYNLGRFEAPVALSVNAYEVLTVANCDRTYHGALLGYWSPTCFRGNPTGDESERGRFWRERGIDYARENAGRLAVVLAARQGRVWDLWRPEQNAEFAGFEGRHEGVSRVGGLTWYGLATAAVIGAMALRRRAVQVLPLAAPVGAVIATAIYAYGTHRFRIAADISVVVLAGIAIDVAIRRLAFARRRRADRKRGLAAAVATMMLAGACMSADEPALIMPASLPSPPEPTTALVLGDSVMYDAYPAIEAALESTGAYESHATTVLGQGLGKVDSFEWRNGWRIALEQRQPEVVLVLVGAWDTVVPTVNGRELHHGSPEWSAWYSGLLDEAAALLTSGGATVYWIGSPYFAIPNSHDRVEAINTEIEGLAARNPKVVFLDGAAALAPPEGGFVESLPDAEGRSVLLRKDDGVHLCPEGAERLARLVVRALGPRLAVRPTLGWEHGGWRQEKRYLDPEFGDRCAN